MIRTGLLHKTGNHYEIEFAHRLNLRLRKEFQKSMLTVMDLCIHVPDSSLGLSEVRSISKLDLRVDPWENVTKYRVNATPALDLIYTPDMYVWLVISGNENTLWYPEWFVIADSVGNVFKMPTEDDVQLLLPAIKALQGVYRD